jgi:ubiquinone/menaquinone biosynthesis C-methylase UbiE
MSNKEDSKRLSQRRFAKFAEKYVTSSDHAKSPELDRLVEIAQPQPDWIVLDVATGGGHTALKFAPLVAQVVVTDITPKMLDTARQFIGSHGVKNAIYELADAEDLPFESETFDLVTCRIAPHHFSDCPRFVREGARVIKSSGMLLVQDHVSSEDEQCANYVEEFERLRDPSHNLAYSESAWAGMFQYAGLKVEYTEHFIKKLQFFTWAERQGCTPETIQKLIRMIKDAPPSVVEWMQPQDFGTPKATFSGHQIIIAGRK